MEAGEERVVQGDGANEDLIDRLDAAPLTRLHLAVLSLCGLAFAFDLMEINVGGALAAIFSAPPHQLGPTRLSWLLSGVYIGAIVGTATMGPAADRFGRRRVLAWLLAVLTLTSAMAALSRSPLELTIARGLSGVTLGAFPPLMVVLLTDLLPARRRGPAILFVCGFAYLGAPLGVFLMRQLSPIQPLGIEGWRWVFWLGALGAGLLGAALLRWVPESPRWLLSQGRTAEAAAIVARFERSRPVLRALPPIAVPGATPPGRLLAGRQGFSLLAALYFLAAWSTVAFPLLSGAVLMEKGLKLSDTLLVVGIATFGPFLGSLLTSTFADAFERRTTLAGCAVVLLIAMAGFLLSETSLMLASTGLVVTLVAAIYVPMLNLYGAEFADGGRRGGMVTGAWTFNRIGAALSPLLLLPLLKSEGTGAMFGVMGASLLLSLLVLAWSPRGAASRTVR